MSLVRPLTSQAHTKKKLPEPISMYDMRLQKKICINVSNVILHRISQMCGCVDGFILKCSAVCPFVPSVSMEDCVISLKTLIVRNSVITSYEYLSI